MIGERTPASPIPVELRPRANALLFWNHRVITVVKVSHPARFVPIDMMKIIAKNEVKLFARGRIRNPPPNKRIPACVTIFGLNLSKSQPWIGLNIPAASCDTENALEIANLLQPN